MELLSEESFISILDSLKILDKTSNITAYGKTIKLEKAKSIIESVKRDEKFDKFLINRYLEEFVLMIYDYKDILREEMESDYIDSIETNDFHINISADEFRKILSRITINDDHLSEAEVDDCTKLYSEILENETVHNILSYSTLKNYALFIYSNRYQIRTLLENKISELPMDKDGNYLLSDDMFISRINRDGGRNSPLWICMNIPEETPNEVERNLSCDIVVKNLFDENERETSLIAEEIARELGLPVAQYYPAIYTGTQFSKSNQEKENQGYVTERIVLTPSFLKPGEELITGDRIAGYDMDISSVPDSIKIYLEKEGVNPKRIEELISQYRIVMAYNCLINHRDCHNGNWGYIKTEDGRFYMSHIFDLEGCLDENVNNIREIYVGDVFSNGKNNIDKDLLIELLKDERCKRRVSEFLELDMENVFAHVRISKGIRIPLDKRNRVMTVINKEKSIIREVIRELEIEEVR